MVIVFLRVISVNQVNKFHAADRKFSQVHPPSPGYGGQVLTPDTRRVPEQIGPGWKRNVLEWKRIGIFSAHSASATEERSRLRFSS